MVAFIGSVVVMVLLCGAVVVYAKRRPVGTPLSWGEAMLAATFVFFLMFWAYGVVPHQWLTWADNELGWRSDAYLVGPSSTNDWPILRDVPANVSKQTIRDLIAVGIYGILLVMQVALWNMWQGRGDKAARAQQALEERTTAFGRPLARKA